MCRAWGGGDKSYYIMFELGVNLKSEPLAKNISVNSELYICSHISPDSQMLYSPSRARPDSDHIIKATVDLLNNTVM